MPPPACSRPNRPPNGGLARVRQDECDGETAGQADAEFVALDANQRGGSVSRVITQGSEG